MPRTSHVVEHDDADAEDHLERGELDRDRGRLAEEDRAAVEAREPQTVAGGVRLLDRERAADREQRCEQHRGPEQAGRDAREQAAVGVEREREQDEHDAAERQHLLQRDARPPLDAQVLARDEQRVAQDRHAHCVDGPTSTIGATGAGAARGRARGRDPRRPATSRVAWRAGELELVRREQHRAPFGRRRGEHRVDDRAAFGVEAGVRLVEQQQLRIAGERDREREAPPLTLREAAVRRRRRPSSSPTRAIAASARRAVRPAARVAKRRFSATVRSS